MKKIVYLLSVLFVAQLFVACGSAKQAAGSSKAGSSIGVEEALSPAEEYALQNPAIRAAGNGVDLEVSAATSLAELDAREKMARTLAAAIVSAQQKMVNARSKAAITQNGNEQVTDRNSGMDAMGSQIAKETVKNAVIVKTNRYKLPNGLYNVWVCLEYVKGLDSMLETTCKKVESLISEDDKLKMNYDFQKYKTEVAYELENMGK